MSYDGYTYSFYLFGVRTPPRLYGFLGCFVPFRFRHVEWEKAS